MAIWRMRIAYWITQATNIHSQYIFLIAFPPKATRCYFIRAFLVFLKWIKCLLSCALNNVQNTPTYIILSLCDCVSHTRVVSRRLVCITAH